MSKNSMGKVSEHTFYKRTYSNSNANDHMKSVQPHSFLAKYKFKPQHATNAYSPGWLKWKRHTLLQCQVLGNKNNLSIGIVSSMSSFSSINSKYNAKNEAN